MFFVVLLSCMLHILFPVKCNHRIPILIQEQKSPISIHCWLFLRLGRPLPHQLPNQTRVHLIPPECFHTVSCDTVRLCGFTSRFQLLSPCMRQVTHALLTRPPLNRPEQAPASIVRLACVKHAASVHPEPGSNSH